jgi:O-antigen/teichoic acid export membrane protein
MDADDLVSYPRFDSPSMSLTANIGTPLMPAVPDQLQSRIVSGIRWTVWATALTAPLAYCVSTLLARMGPEVVGAFGLTGIYSWFASTFLFLGGGAVVMKFIPSLRREKQLSFLACYLLVVLVLALPWQIAGTLKPSILLYAFGNSGSPAMHVLLLWIAPLYVFYLLVDSALAALLEIRYQQLLRRCMSVMAFLAYTTAFFLGRDFLARHYVPLIWTVYLGLSVGAAVAGARRVIKVCKGQLGSMDLSVFLPAGFWKYTLGVQASSMLGLFSSLAGILTLNVGGISAFGRFVALMAIVALIDKPVQLVLSTFLPSLTNALELPEPEVASAVVALWSRLLLASALAGSVVVSLLAAPLVHLFGRGYAELVLLVPIACAGAAIDALNQLAGSLFYAVSRPYANMAGQLARLLALLVCFWPLWTRYHLLGSILALVASQAAQCVVQVAMLTANKTLFRAALSRTLAPYVVTLGSVLVLSRWTMAWAVGGRIAIYAACLPAFFLAAGYSAKELAALARLVLPGKSAASVQTM